MSVTTLLSLLAETETKPGSMQEVYLLLHNWKDPSPEILELWAIVKPIAYDWHDEQGIPADVHDSYVKTILPRLRAVALLLGSGNHSSLSKAMAELRSAVHRS